MSNTVKDPWQILMQKDNSVIKMPDDEECKWSLLYPNMCEWVESHTDMVDWMTEPTKFAPRSDCG